MPGTPLISVCDLRKSYGTLEAVRGVSFDVAAGEVFGVLGRNGAGKTTTLEMVEGLRRIDSGTAVVAGIDVKSNPRAAARAIGIQLQSANFFERLNLVELLELFAALYGVPARAAELLDQVELGPKAKTQVKTLSGGQRQRFGLAVAMVNEPSVLFLDEPTTGLDPHARRRLWDLVRRLRGEARAIVLTTHYIEEAEVLCDRVAVMHEGVLVAVGPPAEITIQAGVADLEEAFLQLTGSEIREADE